MAQGMIGGNGDDGLRLERSLSRAVTERHGAQGSGSMIGLEEAARRCGVHYMTLYRRVRTGRIPAVQRSGRWWVDEKDLENLGERFLPGRSSGVQRWAYAKRRLIARMVATDFGGSWSVVEEVLARGAAPSDVYLKLIAPALVEVGERWAAGTLSVEQEHLALAVAIRVVGRLSPLFTPRGSSLAGTVVLGGAPGDPHLLPVAMVADLLRSRRIRVLELGANVPSESFVEAAGCVDDLRAVGVSLSDWNCSEAAASVLRTLRTEHRGVLLLAGGPAVVDQKCARELGADLWASDGLAAAALLARPAGPLARARPRSFDFAT